MKSLSDGLRQPCQIDESSPRRWGFLWTRPTYTYYHDTFFGNAESDQIPGVLRWRFVPKAISFVISNEFEATSTAQGRMSYNSECLKVCLPLVCLADAVDRHGGRLSRRRRTRLEQHLRRKLCASTCGRDYGSCSRTPELRLLRTVVESNSAGPL